MWVPTTRLLQWRTPISKIPLRRIEDHAARSYATLSAIHTGLRRSERARPQGYGASPRTARSPGASSSPGLEGLTYKQRQAARAAIAEPAFRIWRGKKDITHRPNEARPKSRAARFNDPSDTFGKKSLVYQLKRGNLKEELHQLQRLKEQRSGPGKSTETTSDMMSQFERLDEDRRARKGPSGRSREVRRGRDDRQSPSWTAEKGRRESGSPRESYSQRESNSQRELYSSRVSNSRREPDSKRDSYSQKDSYSQRESYSRREREPDSQRAPFSRRESASQREPYSRREPDSRRDSYSPKESYSQREPYSRRESGSYRESRSEPELTGAERRLKNKQEVMSLPFTTAASQFLYGTSVVKAALQERRRKLYKLYVYVGENRLNLEQDSAIRKLADRRGVSTKLIPDIRVLDKMSGGRPHNGYLLEASPLPQQPVTSLAAMSSDERNPGYRLNLGWQSAEDAEINGTADFVQTSIGGRKPLVVVLDQIQDPGNLGAILRTVSFLGVSAVAVTKMSSASLTPVALKASAGASEALTLYSVESVPRFLDESRENGWKVYAAAPADYKSKQHRHLDLHELQDSDPLSNDPCILIIGSEGEGLSKGLKTRADFEVNIPNVTRSTVVDSLNVGVATGIICSAFVQGAAKAHAAMVESGKLF